MEQQGAEFKHMNLTPACLGGFLQRPAKNYVTDFSTKPGGKKVFPTDMDVHFHLY